MQDPQQLRRPKTRRKLGTMQISLHSPSRHILGVNLKPWSCNSTGGFSRLLTSLTSTCGVASSTSMSQSSPSVPNASATFSSSCSKISSKQPVSHSELMLASMFFSMSSSTELSLMVLQSPSQLTCLVTSKTISSESSDDKNLALLSPPLSMRTPPIFRMTTMVSSPPMAATRVASSTATMASFFSLSSGRVERFAMVIEASTTAVTTSSFFGGAGVGLGASVAGGVGVGLVFLQASSTSPSINVMLPASHLPLFFTQVEKPVQSSHVAVSSPTMKDASHPVSEMHGGTPLSQPGDGDPSMHKGTKKDSAICISHSLK
mmetsp:Transcript_11273/g.20447  ORF Transcript_11273/g.20447 Transcript_11273/m.20447 type:complete len:318 (-) Transcript_11273:551-1504(-)